MTIEGTYYFECLRCGVQAQLVDLPPRCPKCTSGNGIVTERRLPESLPVTPDPVTQATTV